MDIYTRPFEISDYGAAMSLWRGAEGIGLSSADESDRIRAMLDRNPGFSKVLMDGGRMIGTILCGHDGRRETTLPSSRKGSESRHATTFVRPTSEVKYPSCPAVI